jgi:hypothetical protein
MELRDRRAIETVIEDINKLLGPLDRKAADAARELRARLFADQIARRSQPSGAHAQRAFTNGAAIG